MERKPVILIVEDEVPMLKALEFKFTRGNFTVKEAHDGAQGLAIALKVHPDIILLDILMPKMDGITMLRELRKDTWGKTACVIILTNLNDAKSVEDVAREGVVDFWMKTDLTLDGVVELIKEKLNRE